MSKQTSAEALPQPQFLSAEEIAGVLRVSPATVRRWAREKKISSFRAGKSARRFDLAVVLEEIKQQKST
jgi:excisionase family DNA binding protein